MKRITLARLAVLMLAVAGLVLQGCGGDDNGGLSAEDMARIDNAEADAAAARMEAAEAEAARLAAVAAQMAAEAAQEMAEANEAAAVADAADARAAQAMAEANEAAAVAEAAEATAARLIAEAATAAAMADLSDAQDDLDAAEMARDAAVMAQTAAETAQAVAEAMIAAAEAAEAEAEAMAAMYKAAAEEAEASAEMYKEAAEAADTARMTAEAERDEYKMKYEEATAVPTVGTQVGAAARAVASRIMGAVAGAIPADMDSATVESRTSYIRKGSVAMLARDADGVSFDIMQGTTVRLDQDDTADDAAASLAGWQGTALSKTGGGVMQEAVLYSDIEMSVTPFSSKYPYTVLITGAGATAGANTHIYALSVTEAAQLISGGDSVDERISITHGLSSDIPSRMLDSDTATATPMSLRGTYEGVPGQYSCVGTCTLTWTADGVTIAGATGDADDLLFRADNIETLIPDPDHLTFGAWMLAPDGPAAGGLIRPIAAANASMFRQRDLRVLIGSATYTGEATGYYATRAAGSAEATSGRFTATATLMANFDATADTVPDNATGDAVAARAVLHPTALDMNRVPLAATANNGDTARYYRPTAARPGVSFAGSKIDSFMDEDGNMMEGWIVNLNGGVLRRPADVVVVDDDGTDGFGALDRLDAFNDALQAARNAGTFNGTTSGTGGAHEWSGIWDASFHGTNRATTPTGVVGTFQADAGMAHPVDADGAINLLDDPGFAGVIGAFGARR